MGDVLGATAMARAGVGVAVAAALLSAPASAGERLLQPTDEWVLGTRDESCFVTRNFSDPNGKALEVQVEAFGPGSGYKFTMTGEGLPLRDGRRRGGAAIRYRFKPDPDWRLAGATTAYRNGTDELVFLSDLASQAESKQRQRLYQEGKPPEGPPFRPNLQRAAAISAFALAYPARDDTVVQLGPLDAAVTQLHACTGALVGKWGYDPAALERLQTAPRIANLRDIGEKLLHETMLHPALRQNEPISFRLDVDERGAVAGCTMQGPRQNAALGEMLCGLLRDEAQITPATDAAGQPVAAPLVSSFAFAVR